MKRIFIILFALLGATASAQDARKCVPDDPTAMDECTRRDLVTFFTKSNAPDPWPIEAYLAHRATSTPPPPATPPAAPPTAAIKQSDPSIGAASQIMKDITSRAQSPNVALTQVQPTASVHAAQQNFVTPWSIALSSIEASKEGEPQALLVRHNVGSFGVTLAVYNDTSAADAVLKGLSDTQRDAVNKGVNDLDHWSLAISRSFQTETCSLARLHAGTTCIGRDPKTYEDALSGAVQSILTPQTALSAFDFDALRQAQGTFGPPPPSPPPDRKLKEMSEAEATEVVRLIRIAKNVNRGIGERERASAPELSDLLSKLLANQPQLSFSATSHVRDALVGPNEYGATVAYDFGYDNLNSRLRGCTKEKCDALTRTDVSSDNFSFTAAYKHQQAWNVKFLPDGVALTEPFPKSSKSVWTGSALWKRDLMGSAFLVGDRQSNLAVKVDYSKGGAKSGVTVTATLTLPVGRDLNLPVSLAYGSNSDIVPDVKKRVSMHFGITYQLPFGK
jgi:hypothetical protein